MQINKVFDFFDLMEYNEVQKKFIGWATKNGYKFYAPDIFENVNRYCNDTIFTFGKIYSKNGKGAIWITSFDSQMVEEERQKPYFKLGLDLWFSDAKKLAEEGNNFEFIYSGKYTDVNFEELREKLHEVLLKFDKENINERETE